MSENTSEQQGPSPLQTRVLLAVSWLWVGVPFLIGVYQLAVKSAKLFS